MSRNVTEESVGCTRFANESSGFDGIIKHKYSDFHVHEIDPNGKVIYLKSTEPLPRAQYPAGFERWLKSSQKSFSFKIESEQQIALIFMEHPELHVKRIGTQATIEHAEKRRPQFEITRFTLFKENVNQQEAMAKILARLNITQNQLGFAGTKDKRAATTQYVTVRDVPLQKVVKSLSNLDKVTCGEFCYVTSPLKLGDLSGNRFTIAIRGLKIGQKELDEKIKSIQKSGFINYYGMQRFGTGETATHKIGILIIQGKYDAAVDAIMNPVEGEEQRIHEAKIAFQRSDLDKAMELLPHSAVAERKIVEAAHDTNKKYEMFKAVDRRQRMMYVHAYQSYIWNKCASKRAEKGFKVLETDTVEYKGKIKEPTKKSVLQDVVIPLCEGDTKDKMILDMMKEDGVTTEMFRKIAKEYGINTEYRKFMAFAKDIEYSIVKHDNPDVQLINNDVELLNNPKLSRVAKNTGNKNSSAVISFSLGSGEYATMFLRELMKRSTEVFTDQQKSLEADFDEDIE